MQRVAFSASFHRDLDDLENSGIKQINNLMFSIFSDNILTSFPIFFTLIKVGAELLNVDFVPTFLTLSTWFFAFNFFASMHGLLKGRFFFAVLNSPMKVFKRLSLSFKYLSTFRSMFKTEAISSAQN
jgi:hypothetical protein